MSDEPRGKDFWDKLDIVVKGFLGVVVTGIVTAFGFYLNSQQNAINAATRDSRFSPVKTDDLSTIQIEISALTPPTPVSSYQDIVLGRHGIILTKGSHQAVFLPQVAPEQGWDLSETLRHLSLKAGLSGDDWKGPDTEFLVFTAEVIEEE